MISSRADLGKWPLFLIVCHLLAAAVALGTGIYLVVKSNYVNSALAVLNFLQQNEAVRPLEDPNGESEDALGRIRTCLLACGIVSLLATLLILLIISSFLCLPVVVLLKRDKRLPLEEEEEEYNDDLFRCMERDEVEFEKWEFKYVVEGPELLLSEDEEVVESLHWDEKELMRE